MPTSDSDTDPLSEMVRNILTRQQSRIDDHAALRQTDAYKAAIRQIDRYILDYGLGINAIDLLATRNLPLFERLISLRIKPHFVQSMIATSQMIKEGLHDPAKREMRFLVEASVKALWLDQGSPRLRGNNTQVPPRTVAEKVAALDGLGRERFHLLVESLSFGMLDPAAGAAYQQSAKSLYGALSTTTHISTRDVQRDLANFEKGRHFAFETVNDIKAIARLLRQVLDLALASHFEAFDHGLVGELFVPRFVPEWSFFKMPLVSAIDRHFNYKHERSPSRGGIDQD